MDMINVDVVAQQHVNISLDTDNIIENNEQEMFNINDLFEVKNNIIHKLYTCYNKYYEYCIEKIKSSNKLKKTDIIFSVPSIIFANNDYSSKDCITFIENKLKKMKFDTLVVDSRTLFVSWKYVELYT